MLTLGQRKPQSPGRKGKNEKPIPGDPMDKKIKKRNKEKGNPSSVCEDIIRTECFFFKRQLRGVKKTCRGKKT